jgi:hypothetical protein
MSVKHFLLCTVLIALVALVTAAQDRSSENKKDRGSESTPSITIGSRAPWSLQPKGLTRRPTPFITFLESSTTSTLLTPHREYHAVDQAGEKLCGRSELSLVNGDQAISTISWRSARLRYDATENS